MRKTLLALMCALGLICINSFAETVYVNGKAVPQNMVDATINQYSKSSPMLAKQLSNPQVKRQILQSIGMRQAILLEGDQQGLGNSAEFKEKMQDIKPMIYAQMLQERAGSNVSDAEVRAKYEQMKKAAANTKEYDVSHILVADQKTANQVLALLKKGTAFATVAKQYSTDAGSKMKGGELGWSDGANYVPEFSKAVQALKKGQYTTVAVKSQFGYHIIKLNNVRSGSATAYPAFDKFAPQIKQELQMQKAHAYFEGLKNKYKVEVK